MNSITIIIWPALGYSIIFYFSTRIFGDEPFIKRKSRRFIGLITKSIIHLKFGEQRTLITKSKSR